MSTIQPRTNEPQRLTFELVIHWEGSWHVGSGHGMAGVDRLLRQRGCGPKGARVPYVPGSQLKGVLRHHCERLAAILGAEIVSPHVVGSQPPTEVLSNFRPLHDSELLVDRLFGSRFQGECLFVEDAVPGTDAVPSTTLHSRTAIDRLTGTARDRSLFITQIVQGDSFQLRSRLQARHPAGALTQLESSFPYEYALLLASALDLDCLGGDKSAGLGRCRVEIPDNIVRWNDKPSYPLSEALQSFEDEGWYEMLAYVREEVAE